MGKMALIDGDILTYRVGWVSNDVSEAIACARLRDYVLDIVHVFARCHEFTGFLSPRGETFRHRIATTAPYKGGRSAEKPIHYDALRDYMVEVLGFSMAVDEEADDLLGIWLTRLGDEAVCCSLDKDLLTIAGDHCNFVRKTISTVTEEEALTNFYRQIITGDKVDNIIGAGGIGPARAEAIFPLGIEEELMFELCVQTFQGNVDRVIENGKLVRIRRTPGEIWTPTFNLDDWGRVVA